SGEFGLSKFTLLSPATEQRDKKNYYGIDGRHLGSMYADKVTLISTEEGVGVRHSGVVRSIKDVMVKAKGKVASYKI
ncbi:hypothetical protein, partial [Campylobacter fetus]|uniref:hypothetical protein n=1 Tax=Campylobacter fetus TaxID=196 RepID=UPI001967E7A0